MRDSRLRAFLSSWYSWIVVAYLGLSIVAVALYVQNGRILTSLRNATRAETLREAAVQADASSTYRACVISIPTLEEANRFVAGVKELHGVLVENAVAAHRATAPGTALYRAQTMSIQRLLDSQKLVDGLHFKVPSHADCLAQRARILSELSTPPH